MSIGTFLSVLLLLLIGISGVVGTILIAGRVLIGGLIRAQQESIAQAGDLAVKVVSEVVEKVGPLVAREVGDQIRGYPMAAMDKPEGLKQDLPEEPSWYGQATRDDDPTDWDDPTDRLVEDPVDWSPEARVAAASEMPATLRDGGNGQV